MHIQGAAAPILVSQAADTYFCFTWNWVPVTRNSRCFADEAGIRSDYHTGTTWAPVGQTPVVEVTGRRFSCNMISAVSPRGEFRFMIHEGSVTATTFKGFLTRLMVGASKPIFLIVDGHPIHKSKLVKDYVASLDGRLKLFYLPPYAPQLNPDEQDVLRGETWHADDWEGWRGRSRAAADV